MRVSRPTFWVALAAGLRAAAAFAPSRAVADNGGVRCPPLQAGGPPVIRDWRYQSGSGTITGTVTNHPSIPDGNKISTSAVKNPVGVAEDRIVVTRSGSKYKLGKVAKGGVIPAVEAQKAREREDGAKAKAREKETKAAERKRIVEEKRMAAAEKKAAAAEARKAVVAKTALKTSGAVKAKPKVALKAEAKAPAATAPTVDLRALQKQAKAALALTGATVGPGGKYLLAGKPRQSSGRAAKIWTAYLADADRPGVPVNFDGGDVSKVQQLTIKLSPDIERLKLENTNYDNVQKGFFSGRFVKKMEYIQRVSSNKRDIEGNSALVIEAGQYDLKALLAERQGQPLRGRALRDIAVSAGQCVQAVHSSQLVWTDLKTENFIVVNTDTMNQEVGDVNGKLGLPGVKGIDLESVIKRGGNPIDYSPEACPPEFAQAFMGGEGGDFVLDYSYDMWSLGMMLYEVATGVAYFEGMTPREVTKSLCSEGFEVDVSAVPDKKLRDLIGQCLRLEPRRRPDITGFLLHPFFITTGIGPLSF